jgi:hypothetical protein
MVFSAENESVFTHKRPAELITALSGPTLSGRQKQVTLQKAVKLLLLTNE